VRAYALTCALCAGLTATVSLDGAVVLALPVVLGLARHDEALRRPLLLGTVAVTNAASLAVPQGNPTNLVLMERLGLGPAAFIGHLFVPALLATAVCAIVPGLLDRRALRDARVPWRPAAAWTCAERFAAAVLAAAAVVGVVAPWVGVAPWVALGLVAAVAWVCAVLRGGAPVVRVPWRIGAQVAVLVALVSLLPAVELSAGSGLAVVAVALGVGALAGAVNNLPASVALAGLLGTPGVTAYAALAGLSVGALATPRGSVATLIAFQRAGTPRGYVLSLVPTAAAATALAASAVWLLR
jgi:arsenical pump membrane protein